MTVTPATLTISAQNATQIYGKPVPSLKATYSGFVNGDSPSSLTKQATLSTTSTGSSQIGSYPITVSGASSPNYTIQYVPGVLTVQPNQGQAAFIETLYQRLMGRQAETSGLEAWLTELNNGTSESTVAQQIYTLPEAKRDRANGWVARITEQSAYLKALQAQAVATGA